MTTAKSLDPDQQRVYDAEHQLQDVLDRYPGSVRLAGSTITVPVERKFGDTASIQRYVNHVAEFLTTEGMVGPRALRGTPIVVMNRATSKATYSWSTNQIRIPDRSIGRSLTRWAMRETVVLHEIAHWLTPHGASHGTEFQSAFMWLLDHVVAPEAGFVFRFFLAQAVR